MTRAKNVDFQSDYDGETLRVRFAGHGVARLILNRPSLRNAFNAEMISELNDVLAALAACRDERQMRVLVLEGAGTHFCAGADLAYMQEQAKLGEAQSLRDARLLGTLFFRLASFPTTVVAAVRGAAIGGGFGLVCCADVVVCDAHTVFATSEVRLGIVPGVISPYIVRKLGLGSAALVMLSGEKITAAQAFQLGIVNCVVEDSNHATFSEKLADLVSEHLKAAPNAVRRTKELLRKISPLPDPGLFEFTAASIAAARCSTEGQHGLGRFFDKQSPEWSATVSADSFGALQ